MLLMLIGDDVVLPDGNYRRAPCKGVVGTLFLSAGLTALRNGYPLNYKAVINQQTSKLKPGNMRSLKYIQSGR